MCDGGEGGGEEMRRRRSPMMHFSSFTWHRSGNGGLPASSPCRPLSEHTKNRRKHTGIDHLSLEEACLPSGRYKANRAEASSDLPDCHMLPD